MLATVLLKPNDDGTIPFKQGSGTGFVVSKDGYVVTALHTLRAVGQFGTPAYSIQFSERLERRQRISQLSTGVPDFGITSELVAFDEAHDIAVLKPVEPTKALPIRFFVDNVSPGEEIFLLGFPLSFETLALRTGVIATDDTGELESTEEFKDAYWAALRIAKGDSGGPVFRRNDAAFVGLVLKFANETTANSDANYNSGLTYVLSAKYVADLLRKHHIQVQYESHALSCMTRK